MQLHRTTGQPDWSAVPRKQWNSWQRMAARTHGWLTPGNVITIFGLAAVLYGLLLIGWHHYWYGIGIVLVGRLCDLLDGWLANRTGTKSHIGEAADVVADKIETFASLIILLVVHCAPWWILLVVLLPQISIPLITYSLFHRGKRLHPSRLGKLSMASAWFCLLGLFIVQAAHAEHTAWSVGMDTLAVLSGLGGIVAASRYMAQA